MLKRVDEGYRLSSGDETADLYAAPPCRRFNVGQSGDKVTILCWDDYGKPIAVFALTPDDTDLFADALSKTADHARNNPEG